MYCYLSSRSVLTTFVNHQRSILYGCHASKRYMSNHSKETIGLIGLGKMGINMAVNIMEAGHELYAYDIDSKAIDAAVAKGAKPTSSPEDLSSKVQTIISMVPNDKVLKEIGGNKSSGILKSIKPGTLHISCSTVSPHTSRELSKIYEEMGCSYLGAPIFARPDGVAQRQAYFSIGGKKDAYKRAEPILNTTSSELFYFGEDAGAGNVVKLCGNFLIATSIESIAEACQLAESNGVDRVKAMEMLNSTIFDCLIYKGYGQRVSERDHVPGGFALELGFKDVGLVMDTAHRANVPLPFGSVLYDRFLSSYARGRGGLDWSAVGLSVSEDSGVDISEAIKRSSS